ncbi:MAG: ABC transporter substrate-binding protein, partial [Candidatus Binatia bacterium]
AAAVRGVPVKILAVFQDRPGWDLIAQPDIKSVAQLRGTTIGIMSPEGSLAVVTKEILKKHGMDPVKDANLIVMGGDDVRLMALKGKAIQATLMNVSASLRAQKDGFSKLATAGDYVNYVQGGLSATDERIKQQPAKTAKFMRASLKGLTFYFSKREASIRCMMEALRLQDRDTANAIYELESRTTVRDAAPDEKIMQSLIDDMRKTTKTQREVRFADVFDFSFVRKANEELKASGWRP